MEKNQREFRLWLLSPQIWPRRQEIQQVPVRPTQMKGIERTNAVVKNLLQREGGRMRRDSYAMDMDRERNCYSCGGFGYFVQNCRRWRIVGQERRMEYENNENARNNLNGKKSLIVLD